MSGQALAVRFDQKGGEMMVYGGALISAFVFSLAVARVDVMLFIISLLLLVVVYFYMPMILKNRPPMVIAPHGLFIDGLGLIPWSQVRKAEMKDKAVRSIRNAELTLTLTRALKEVVEPPESKALWRQYMFQIWREPAPGTITFKMEPLLASPDEVLAAIKGHIPSAA